jgi:N-acetyl-anhydromuramyl-L-alanine amidase AmpD
MSIFRNTFQDDIKKSLTARQEAMTERTPDIIQYLNSRNSYIRMTSSVNVGGSADLAKKNVLLGGTLNRTLFGGLKSGVGKTNEAYSTRTPGDTADHRLGIRLMPGIVSMDIKSKSAYGSLREAVVNFQCWDIQQLEELELLYMRPGYTVLVEWGWLPYLDNNKKIVTTPPIPYDILLKGITDRRVIFKQLYDKSTTSGGNYDAMFGYIKNYQWSARPDGGYDCQTTIISTGEIVESLKVNYVLPDLTKLNNATTNGDGFLNAEFATQGKTPPNFLKEYYERNTLAGIWAESYFKLREAQAYVVGGTTTPVDVTVSPTSIFKDKFHVSITPALKSINANSPDSLSIGSIKQVYITLEAAFDIINKYVIPKDNGTPPNPLMELSTYTEGYASLTTEPLLCVAHPVEVSVDPTVCLINSPLWYEKGGILYAVSGAATISPAQTIADEIKLAVKNVASVSALGSYNTALNDFSIAISKISSVTDYIAVEGFLGGPGSIQNYLSKNISSGGITGIEKSGYISTISHLRTILGTSNVVDTYKSKTSTGGFSSGGGGGSATTTEFLESVTITTGASAAATASALAISSISSAIANLEDLKSLKPFFYNSDYNTELGYIGNIYVNLDFLYKQSLDANLEASDNKEKNEISLYKYIKSIISAIQTSLGNLNNFEVHVDPIDNKARVIDVNFTGNKNPSLFKLQVHNLNSVVRNYSLQSQIFPEQSSIIAIGSQAKGGQLGIQNNTMIDFNTGLTDRIIEKKDFGIKSDYDVTSSTTKIASNLGSIVFMFGTLSTPPPLPVSGSTTTVATAPAGGTDLNTLFTRCKSNLRDLIVYFQSITSSSGANRSIIPTKFSFEMDGIGGLVIGNLFTINQDILPKGYKGGGTGAKLAQTITGISHTLSNNNDWTTKIDALNISLNNNSSKSSFSSLNLASLVATSFKNSLLSRNPSSSSPLPAPLRSFAPSGRKRTLNDVTQIILHDTDGHGGIEQVIDVLNSKNNSIHYIVERGGKSFNQTPLDRVAGHAGATANATSVGIEICNLGMLTERNGGKDVYHATGKRQFSTTPPYKLTNGSKKGTIESINSSPSVTAGVKDLGFYVNLQRHYEGYTVSQITELKRVIKEILNQCPNIKLNYAANDLSIYQNVFGLKTLTTMPTKGEKLTTTRDFIGLNKGIYAHAVISTQRNDAHIDPLMIQMLKEIKLETGR